MEEVVVEGTTGDQEEVLAMREQTEPRWVELVTGCLDITLEVATTEVGVREAASSVGRGDTKPMTVQTKEEEEEVVEVSVEVGVGLAEVGEEVEDATVMLHHLNSKGISCSKMETSPLVDAMEVEVVEEEEEDSIREEVADIKAMEVNMTDLEEVMEVVGMDSQA